MTSYGFDIVTEGDWSDAKDWANGTTGRSDDGTPGAGDTADIYDYFETTIVTTEGQSVGTVLGTGDGGTDELNGTGLAVSDDMIGLTLLTGSYSVGGVARDVTLEGGASLSGNAIGGTTAGLSGLNVDGGVVTESTTFWGNITQGGTVTTDTALSVSVSGSGSSITANAIDLNGVNGGEIVESSGTIVTGSVSIVGGLNGDGGGVSGGTFTDSGALSISGTIATFNGEPVTVYGVFDVSAGAPTTVGGAANVGNFGSLGVWGDGQLQLKDGLTVAAAQGSKSEVSVGSPVGAGGKLTVSGGNVDVGLNGTATLSITYGGVVTATQLYVGGKAKGAGTVQVSGSKSALTLTGAGAEVGVYGTGQLLVEAGGSLSFRSGSEGLDIGAEAGGIGVVTIDGATTKVRLNGSLMSVGEKGNGTLVLKNAQHLVAGEVDVAFNSGSNGNVSIQGAKTELDAGALDISGKGSSGGKGVVTVSDGILLVRDDTTVGEGGSLTITAQTSGQSSEIHLGSWLVNDGAVTADWNVLIAGAVSGEGAIDVGGDGVVIFQESVGTAQKVQFTGPGIIEIDSASAFHATIYGFNRVGTSIDLRNVAFSKSMGVNLVGSTLIVTPTKGAAVDLKLGGSLPAAVIVKKDGKGGTFIYVTPRRKEGANSPLIASQLHAEPLQNAQALSNLLAPFSRDDLSGMTASRSHLESRDFNSAWGWLGAADGAFSSPEASLVPLHLGYDSLIG